MSITNSVNEVYVLIKKADTSQLCLTHNIKAKKAEIV